MPNFRFHTPFHCYLGRFFIFAFMFKSALAWSGFYSPSGTEYEFKFRASFVSESVGEQHTEQLTEQAIAHSRYLFGLLQSPALTEALVADPSLGGFQPGLGNPRQSSASITRVTHRILKDGRIEVSYSYQGRVIILKSIAEQLLGSGSSVTLSLPYDLSLIYEAKCSDKSFPEVDYYWYFYDVYRKGCEHLQASPYSAPVEIGFTKLTEDWPQTDNQFIDTLRGDNGNGSTFSIALINGFNSSASDRRDLGRASFNSIKSALIKRGFEMTSDLKYPYYPQRQFEKSISTPGGPVTIKVKVLAINSEMDSEVITFARWMRDSLAQDDALIYFGHSGLGENLDIDGLNQKLAAQGDAQIEPGHRKSQLVFFDSCSSYAYYLDPYLKLKRPGTLWMMTNGLESFFDYQQITFETLFDGLTDWSAKPTLRTLLKSLEDLAPGSSLISVGTRRP